MRLEVCAPGGRSEQLEEWAMGAAGMRCVLCAAGRLGARGCEEMRGGVPPPVPCPDAPRQGPASRPSQHGTGCGGWRWAVGRVGRVGRVSLVEVMIVTKHIVV